MGLVTDIIGMDADSIVVTRHTKAPDGAGGDTLTETVLAAQSVRVYRFTKRNQYEMTLPGGEVKVITHGVLAEAGADFAFDHDSHDTFPFEGRTYRVVGVRDYDSTDFPNCIQVDCVAV